MAPGGEEYKSFHYLMHEQQVKGGRVDYVDAPKPLSFEELYSPRESPTFIGKVSKSFWRTRENFDFHIFELRKEKLITICCVEMNNKVTFKTVVCQLEPIYKQIDDKKRGDKADEPLIRKNQKGFSDDASLFVEVVKFLEQRLNIGKDPIAWPKFVPLVEGAAESGDAPEKASDVDTAEIGAEGSKGKGMVGEAAALESAAEVEPEGPKERMVQLSKLAADSDSYEVPVETLTFLKVDLSAIPAGYLKLAPDFKDDKTDEKEPPQPSNDVDVAPVAQAPTPTPAPAPAPAPAPTPAPAPAPGSGKAKIGATGMTPSPAKTKPVAKQGTGSKKTAKVAPA